MAKRKPLVRINGEIRQLPDGDTVTGCIGGEGSGDSTPAGIITMWHGSIASIPFGWALCDGTNGTPDLRDRFVMGAGGNYTVGAKGGSENQTVTVHPHTLTVAQMPSHKHGRTFYVKGSYVTTDDVDWAALQNGQLKNRDKPTVYKNDLLDGQGGSQPHTHGASITSNLPPYYALAYIMKL